MALAIAEYEDDSAGHREGLSELIEGAEGFRFISRPNKDGSIRFDRDREDKPLLSERLLGRLMNVENARTGFFDRWRLTPGRALFRRGNPFMDGIEDLLNLDDRGQAVAMWRLNRRWPQDPLAFFGFDFLIEADVRPDPRSCSTTTMPPVRSRAAARTRRSPRSTSACGSRSRPGTGDRPRVCRLPRHNRCVKGRDVNLNFERIPRCTLWSGGEANLAPVAECCFEAARKRVD